MAQFVESKFGNHLLMDKMGHVYQVNNRSRNGTKIYWTCRQRTRIKDKMCVARGATKGIYVLKWTGEHNHEVIEHQLQNYERKYVVNDPRCKKTWKKPDQI